MATNAEKLQQVAQTVISECLREGINVMRYDAKRSNSIYLKFDDGIVGSMRISDHPSNKRLKYKYNIVLGSKRIKRTNGCHMNLYTDLDDVQWIVRQVKRNYVAHKARLGTEVYQKLMKKNRDLADRTKGFWASAKYITQGEIK